MTNQSIIKLTTDLMMPVFIAITFKGLTAFITFIGVFFYCLNQIGLFRIMLSEKYNGSLKEYLKNKFKR